MLVIENRLFHITYLMAPFNYRNANFQSTKLH